MVAVDRTDAGGRFFPLPSIRSFQAIALPTGGTGLVFLLEFGDPVMMTGPGRRSRVCRTSVSLLHHQRTC